MISPRRRRSARALHRVHAIAQCGRRVQLEDAARFLVDEDVAGREVADLAGSLLTRPERSHGTRVNDARTERTRGSEPPTAQIGTSACSSGGRVRVASAVSAGRRCGIVKKPVGIEYGKSIRVDEVFRPALKIIP